MVTDYSVALTFKNGATTVATASAAGSDEVVRSNEIDPGNVIELPTGSTDVVIPLGEVTPALDILLESTQPLSVRINTATVAIPFKVLALVGTSVTALTVSNNSGNTAILKYTLKG